MSLLKLQSADGFVTRDFDDAPSGGIVRRARKILESSAADLARSATYSFAAFEIPMGGASAGINIEGDPTDADVAVAVSAAIDELAELGAQHQISFQAGKGLTAEQTGSLAPTQPGTPSADPAVIAGVLAATAWALDGGLNGRRIAIEETPAAPAPTGLAAALREAGAELVTVEGVEKQPWKIWSAEVDAILAGSKLGVLNHQGAELLQASAVIPWGPLPYTTRALAVAHRLGRTRILPDFVTAGGPQVIGVLPGLDPDRQKPLTELANRVTSILAATADHPDGPVLGASHHAESFLTTWRSELPFGRPMAA